jgi:putative membrane protein
VQLCPLFIVDVCEKETEMKKFIIRLLINAVGLYLAIALLNGRGIIPQSNHWASLLWLALIFGLVNAILRPILVVAGCPFIILTLGFGTLLINTLLFYLAGIIGTNFGVGFTVTGFWPALLGSLIVSVVSMVLSSIFREGYRRKN